MASSNELILAKNLETLFGGDILMSGVACELIEEFVLLGVLYLDGIMPFDHELYCI